MANCCYSSIWTNHYIISNVDFFDVKYCQVEVSSKIVADENVFAISKQNRFAIHTFSPTEPKILDNTSCCLSKSSSARELNTFAFSMASTSSLKYLHRHNNIPNPACIFSISFID